MDFSRRFAFRPFSTSSDGFRTYPTIDQDRTGRYRPGSDLRVGASPTRRADVGAGRVVDQRRSLSFSGSVMPPSAGGGAPVMLSALRAVAGTFSHGGKATIALRRNAPYSLRAALV